VRLLGLLGADAWKTIDEDDDMKEWIGLFIATDRTDARERLWI
jgi:hypothetical protein